MLIPLTVSYVSIVSGEYIVILKDNISMGLYYYYSNRNLKVLDTVYGEERMCDGVIYYIDPDNISIEVDWIRDGF